VYSAKAVYLKGHLLLFMFLVMSFSAFKHFSHTLRIYLSAKQLMELHIITTVNYISSPQSICRFKKLRFTQVSQFTQIWIIKYQNYGNYMYQSLYRIYPNPRRFWSKKMPQIQQICQEKMYLFKSVMTTKNKIPDKINILPLITYT
jgi:hypothetical protein